MVVRNLWLQIYNTFYPNGNKTTSYTVTAKRELAYVMTSNYLHKHTLIPVAIHVAM